MKKKDDKVKEFFDKQDEQAPIFIVHPKTKEWLMKDLDKYLPKFKRSNYD